MTLPALSQTYYSDVDYALDFASAASYARSILWAWKAALKKEILTANTASITGWTCAGSSDGVTGAMDGVDRWGTTFDATKIIRATGVGARSWMVLYNSGLGLWLTIDYQAASDNLIDVWLALAAPTGGSSTTRATSTLEVQMLSDIAFCEASAARAYMHRVATASGHMMVFTSRAGVRLITSVFGTWPLADVKTSDTFNWTTIFDYASTGAFRTGNTTTGQWRSTTPGMRTRNKANSGFLLLVPSTWQSFGGTQLFGSTLSKPDDFEGKLLHAVIYMLSTATPTVKGRLTDCHQAPAWMDGSASPLTSTPTHLSIGNVFIPFSLIPRL